MVDFIEELEQAAIFAKKLILDIDSLLVQYKHGKIDCLDFCFILSALEMVRDEIANAENSFKHRYQIGSPNNGYQIEIDRLKGEVFWASHMNDTIRSEVVSLKAQLAEKNKKDY